MKFHVRDHRHSYPGRPAVNEDHGTRASMDEAMKRAREVAIRRGFDPATFWWAGDSRRHLMLMTRTDYTYIGVEVEAGDPAGALPAGRLAWRRYIRGLATGQHESETIRS